MAESEFDCCESSDDEYLYSNNTNDHKLKDTEIPPLKHSNCNRYLEKADDCEEKEIDESSNVKCHSKENEIKREEKDSCDIPTDDTKTPKTNDTKNRNLDNRRLILIRNSKLNKSNTVDNCDPSSRLSDKIKQMNTFFSVDKLPDVENYAEKSSSVKRLSVDPEFQQKMKDLYYPMPNSALYSNNKTFSDIKTDIKTNLNRLNSNCEIVEENLSPVSTTAKSLEQQLSFSAAPKSPSLYPKIPKSTRFARLSKFLSVSPEPDEENSEFVDSARKD